MPTESTVHEPQPATQMASYETWDAVRQAMDTIRVGTPRNARHMLVRYAQGERRPWILIWW